MRVVIMGTDSPLLSPRQIQAAFDELGFCEAVLGPCPDGGFYLIGLRRLPSGLFRGVRWSTRFACRDMLRNLLARGASCSLLSAVPDVDRPRDVKNLAGTLARSPGGRRLAPATWQFLKDWTAGGKARSKKRSRR